MKIVSIKILFSIVLLLLLNPTVFADNRSGHSRIGSTKSQRQNSHSVQKRKPAHQTKQPYYSPPFQSAPRRYNDYYKPGYSTRYLPRGHNRVFHRNREYYFYDGYFYQPYRNDYRIVDAPLGAIVLSLPRLHFNLQWNGIDFFLAGNTYYRRHRNGYMVVRDPGFHDRRR